jgi:phosphotransferase system  glucose/maltose/N-acetylglucosamine-specific IIC component
MLNRFQLSALLQAQIDNQGAMEMRDFFIGALDKLITVIVVLMIIGVVGGALFTMFSPMGGFLQGLGLLIFGGLYVVLMGGMMYLFLGIYHNTKRTADILESRS